MQHIKNSTVKKSKNLIYNRIGMFRIFGNAYFGHQGANCNKSLFFKYNTETNLFFFLQKLSEYVYLVGYKVKNTILMNVFHFDEEVCISAGFREVG